MGSKTPRTISEKTLREQLKVGDRELVKQRGCFPTPTSQNEHGPRWDLAAVRAWLTANRRYKPAELLVHWWPDPDRPAELLGATAHYDRTADTGAAAVVQRWAAAGGEIAVVWPISERWVDHEDLVRWTRGADARLVIGADWGIPGPSVWATTGADTTDEKVEIDWSDLARVLGQPAPYWPAELRHPALLRGWRPGTPPVQDVGVLDVDVVPLTRMALHYPPDHYAHRALIAVAQAINNRGDANESTDLGILAERQENGWITAAELVLAAEPAPNDAADLSDPDETVMRAGWAEIIRRRDRLAEDCVRLLKDWDGGRWWPYSHTITISRDGAVGREFLARLEPADRTAVYAAFDHHQAQPMVDPHSDIPVLVPTDPQDEVKALARQRLATDSPLAELILEQPIWVRTADGTVYPAPYDHRVGLNWGYQGTGPANLAILVSALLQDITTRGNVDDHDVPAGLLALLSQDLPAGTVLTRAQLERARDEIDQG